MTAMPDSIYTADLPPGYPAYLGYVDGQWQTAPVLRQQHPGARVVGLTVTGGELSADGVDCERGNVGAAKAAAFVLRKLDADPGCRPVVYASLATDGYSMTEILAVLAEAGVQRPQVRIHTAHYTGEAHLCSASSCGGKDADGNLIAFTADATQWTDKYPGVNGRLVDMSEVSASYFGDWVFSAVRQLAVAKTGPHSVRLTWASPGTPQPLAVHHYQVVIRHQGQDVKPHYPCDVAKTGGTESWQGNYLKPGTQYEALVRARAADDGHASPWASVTFTTPAS